VYLSVEGLPVYYRQHQLAVLWGVLRSHLNVHSGIEVSLESNPGSAETDKFTAYRDAGINRLSIGAQSFDNKKLQSLGRIHDANEVYKAISMAKQAGFDSINVDIMYGLPGQGIDEAINDLQLLRRQMPDHISWYQLTIEPNTVFYKHPPRLPDDDVTWAMQQQGQLLLQQAGFEQYEISAYSLEGYQCNHNLNYWQFGDYLGIGAGAHGKLTDIANGTITRYARHRIPESYMRLAGDPEVISETRLLNKEDVILEFMMNALRLIDGIQPSLFLQRTGMPMSVIEHQLHEAENRELIEWNINID